MRYFRDTPSSGNLPFFPSDSCHALRVWLAVLCKRESVGELAYSFLGNHFKVDGRVIQKVVDNNYQIPENKIEFMSPDENPRDYRPINTNPYLVPDVNQSTIVTYADKESFFRYFEMNL